MWRPAMRPRVFLCSPPGRELPVQDERLLGERHVRLGLGLGLTPRPRPLLLSSISSLVGSCLPGHFLGRVVCSGGPD